MRSQRTFKILSIDGGGIKGLYTSTILEHLEEEFDCAISDHFDLLCGTSTGGLIALALSLKISAKAISNIYKEHANIIFPNPNGLKRFINKLKQVLFYGKYNNEGLQKILQTIFGETKLEDSLNLLCIPAYSVTDGRPWVFKYDHSEGKLSRDNGALYTDVALATSAAPSYLPIHEISYYNNKQFIDGGVWANNPALVGLIEALKYFVGKGKKYDSIEILSISSLTKETGQQTGWSKNRSLAGWNIKLFDSFMNGQNMLSEYFLESLSALGDIPINYVRIPSAPVSPDQAHLVDMDSTAAESLDLLLGKGNDVGMRYRKDDRLKKIFNTFKTYNP